MASNDAEILRYQNSLPDMSGRRGEFLLTREAIVEASLGDIDILKEATRRLSYEHQLSMQVDIDFRSGGFNFKWWPSEEDDKFAPPQEETIVVLEDPESRAGQH